MLASLNLLPISVLLYSVDDRHPWAKYPGLLYVAPERKDKDTLHKVQAPCPQGKKEMDWGLESFPAAGMEQPFPVAQTQATIPH